MLTHSSMKSARRRHFSVSIALAMVLAIPGLAQTQTQQHPPKPGHISVVAPTTQKPPKKEGHGPETYPGRTPKQSNYGQTPTGSTDGKPPKGSNNSGTTNGSTNGGTPKGSTSGPYTRGSTNSGTPNGSTNGGTSTGSTDGQPSKGSTNGPYTRGSTDGGTPKNSNNGGTSRGSTDGGNSKGSSDGQPSRGSTDGGTSTNTPPNSPGQFPPRTRPLPFGFELYIPYPSDFHNDPLEKLARNGPQVSDKMDMTGFVVKGFVHPNWPIVLDFILDSPGDVQMDITAADNSQFKATIHNTPNRRAYAIFRLPPNFGTQLQTATYYVHSVPVAGATTPAPGLRTFGLGAGDKAVGSVAIDQLTFQPATIHPEAKEVANFGFHAHSAFDGVRAEFVIASLYNGRILVEKDQEEKLSPVPEGVRLSGTWEGKGKPGEHMLQIRAWRGLENGGDWVVAWSPDIVDVVK